MYNLLLKFILRYCFSFVKWIYCICRGKKTCKLFESKKSKERRKSMKIVMTIVKILAVLAMIAGAIYLLATYGDKIVAWCKKMLPKKGVKAEIIIDEEDENEADVENIDDSDFVG